METQGTKSKILERASKPETTATRASKFALQAGNVAPQVAPGLENMQQAVGNLALQRMLRNGMIQAKLMVGSPQDPLEDEADQIAEQVMQLKPTPCNCGGRCADCQGRAAQEPSLLRKSADHSEHASGADGTAPDSFRNRLSHGDPLDTMTRASMESRFGRDFSRVRVHTGNMEAQSARLLHARAYTLGLDIAFGTGQYAPRATEGMKLLAHELAHVVQQQMGQVLPLSPSVPFSHASSEPGSTAVIRRQNDRNRDPVAEAARIADEVYNALAQQDNEPGLLQELFGSLADIAARVMTTGIRVIRALVGHNAATRALIQEQFQLRHHQSLQAYLKERLEGPLEGEWLVRAYALLKSDNIFEQHTAMALGLITHTRDEEMLRILFSLPLTGRQELERRYNDTFGEAGNGALKIGTGSLKGDLKDDLSGWRKEKSLALLNRDLTSADELYFDSVAIRGTHTHDVIARIQAEWDKGPVSFAGFERDWDQYVRNQVEWTDETWTNMTLYEAMDDELSGESWQLVKAVLRGFETYKVGVSIEMAQSLTDEALIAHEPAIASQPVSEKTLWAQEKIQLQVAEDTLTAATIGGYTGIGTNNEQVFRAVASIRRIWQQRIERARQAGDTERQKEYEQGWEERRQRLMASIPDEMDTDTVEYQRVRLLTLGELTLADELYLAKRDNDDDRVISLVTSDWAQGKMDQLLEQARVARQDASGTVVRPIFNPTMTVPVSSGTTFSRVARLTYPGLDDETRGSERLALEIDEGDSDSDLKKAYELLTTHRISVALRSSVIKVYAANHLAKVEGATPVQKFLSYIADRYKDSTAVWDFRDLLDPSTKPDVLRDRARGRYAATHTGILDTVLNDLQAVYDDVTGESTEQVTQESLGRLQFIAEKQAQPEELQAMMAMAGVNSAEELSSTEYQVFRSRLNEVRRIRRAITEAVVTIAQLAAEMALTIVTGGAAGPMLLASLASTTAGMVARELLLGKDYDLLSRENAQQLLLTVASHGFGALGRGVFAEAISPERLRQLGRAGAFLEGATTEAVSQIGTQTLAASFDRRMPTAEGIAASALSIFGASMGSGFRGTIMHRLGEHTTDVVRLRTGVVAHITQNIISGVSEEGANIVRTGVENLSAGEIAQRFGQRTGESVGRGLLGGIGDFGAHQVARARQSQLQGQPDTKQNLEGLAEDPSRLMEEQQRVTSPRAAVSGEPQTITVVKINDLHALSVRRNADGSIILTICSPGCGQIRMLLEGLRTDFASQPEHGIHATINRHLGEVAEIERQLSKNIHDQEANARLEALARRANELMGRVGENRFFGVPAEPETSTAPAPAGSAQAPVVEGLPLTVPQRRLRALEIAQQQAETDPIAAEGLRRLEQLFTNSQSRGEILLWVAPENLNSFLRVLRDPAWTTRSGRAFFSNLSNSPEAMVFVRAYGGGLLRNLEQIYGQAAFGPELLNRASARLSGASIDEERQQLIAAMRAAPDRSRMDALLGIEPPPRPPRLARATRENMGIDRKHSSWQAFREEVEDFASSHGQRNLSDEQLNLRADLEQIIDRARNDGELYRLPDEVKRGILNRFDEMGEDSGMLQGWINSKRGNLAEYLFIDPAQRNQGKPAFRNGRQLAPGESREGSTIPDYTTSGGGVTERVNLKSDLIDRGTRRADGAYDRGIEAARTYRTWALEAVVHLPSGDRLSVDFVHDPGPTTRLRMLQILFGEGSPIYRVRFAGGWYDRSSLQ